jgi:hypothetical protein
MSDDHEYACFRAVYEAARRYLRTEAEPRNHRKARDQLDAAIEDVKLIDGGQYEPDDDTPSEAPAPAGAARELSKCCECGAPVLLVGDYHDALTGRSKKYWRYQPPASRPQPAQNGEADDCWCSSVVEPWCPVHQPQIAPLVDPSVAQVTSDATNGKFAIITPGFPPGTLLYSRPQPARGEVMEAEVEAVAAAYLAEVYLPEDIHDNQREMAITLARKVLEAAALVRASQ